MARKTGTGNRCAVCTQGHEVRAEVDRLLADGRTLREIAQGAGVGIDSIRRHRNHCPPLPGIVPPAPPPAVSPSFDPNHLLAIAIKATELNMAIAIKHREAQPEIASRAASRAANSATRLLEVAADHHHRREISEKLDRLRAELDRRDAIDANATTARAAEPVEPWDADQALRRALGQVNGSGWRRPN